MKKKKITLALQGGGSHGAFTWGVLEKLFEEDVFDILGICGTSAGAMNAAMAAYGYHKNGNQGAIDLLKKFWYTVSTNFLFSPIQASVYDKFMSPGSMAFSWAYNAFNIASTFLSPYQWNPLNINPLKSILSELIDFDELRKSKMELFVCATNVKTGQAKIFNRKTMSVDALLASACLPNVYQAVEIDKEFYWDGGFRGNPPLFPLIKGTKTNDVLLVHINPYIIHHVPEKADEITHRINELSFNSSLVAELELIYFKNKVLAKGFDMDGELRKIRFHSIITDDTFDKYDISSKSNASWDFINRLRNEGRTHAENWLKSNYDNVENDATDSFSQGINDEFFYMVKNEKKI
ncbi:MAG TPA: patatin-like phospholipase family protein [Chitinophagales bacterium]|nr:patatin-like phospholipase family protein [Chitinophagales bacterium]